QHLGVAELHEHGAFGMPRVVAGDRDRAQCIGSTALRADEAHRVVLQDFFCDERRMASLISLIERSISASSSSSGTSWPITLAWIVDAKTSSPSVCVEMPEPLSAASALSHSIASTETLSLFGPPLRRACSTSSGTASEMAFFASCSVITASVTLPHRPSEHSSRRSPGCSSKGPTVSTTGLPGLPRQVKSTLRLKRSPIGTTWLRVSCSSEYEWSRVRAISLSPRTMYSRESPQCAQYAAWPGSTQATTVVRGVSISDFCVA